MKPCSLLSCFALVLMLMTNGCGRANTNWEDVVREWDQQGWHKEETFGTSGDFVLSTFMKSETAGSITAVWVIKGERFEKRFDQGAKKYSVLTFSKPDGDSFAVVLSRQTTSP